ncbi:MAG: DNA polymerase III subunit epsilon, partial [Thermus sp.]|uniref:3'-5' exonuclease n=1 Tax=Thermus sp. TaxID=275 RepID=UPI00331B4597
MKRELLHFLGVLLLCHLLVAMAAAWAVWLVYSDLPPEAQSHLLEALKRRAPLLGLLGILLLAPLALLLQPLFLGFMAAARALGREVEVILRSNPGHRLPLEGPWAIRDLAQKVNALAEKAHTLEEEAKRREREVRKSLELEHERFLALLANLPLGVVMANQLGQVVLYNPWAKALLPDLFLGKNLYALLREVLAQALEAPGHPFALNGLRLRTVPLPQGFLLLLEGRANPVPKEGGAPSEKEALSLKDLARLVAQTLEDRLGYAPGVRVEGEGFLEVERLGLLRALKELAGLLAQAGVEALWLEAKTDQNRVELALYPVPHPPHALLEEVRRQGGRAVFKEGRTFLSLPLLGARPQDPLPERPPLYDFRLLEATPSPLLRKPLREALYTALDLETTGLDPEEDAILAIGAVRLLGDRILPETFEALLDPGRPIPQASSQVHGITEEMVRGQPKVQEVLPEFFRFQEGSLLLAHNGAFDLAFLSREGKKLGLDFPRPLLDTLLLAQLLFEEGDLALEALARRFGVPVLGRHTALGDAL